MSSQLKKSNTKEETKETKDLKSSSKSKIKKSETKSKSNKTQTIPPLHPSQKSSKKADLEKYLNNNNNKKIIKKVWKTDDPQNSFKKVIKGISNKYKTESNRKERIEKEN